ncbi:MAG: TIGR03936 family radical SAM-associated protein, partial [Candidatus Zixiibacteriota bacterium]
NQVEKQIANTGQEEITLLSLSSSDYPDIENLAINLARHLEKQRVSISLPSLRPGTISPLLLDAVKKVRRGGLTISPEAGTERLRLFIRKHFDDNTIYDTARMAFDKGWTTIKLYFMIGLPSETEEDISGIVNIIKNIHEIGKKYPGRKTINVTLSPFVPKPHTPFQWDEIAPPNIILKKIKFIKNNLRINHVNLKYPLTESSLLQCLLGRSGREMSNVIASAYFKGCRFDGWNEDFKFDIWKDALIENEINIDEKLKSIPFDTPLPWSHIEKGVSSNHLIKERQRTSAQLNKYPPGSKSSVLSERDIIQNEYGRTKKKVISYQSIAPTKNRVRIRWGKSAHYRYMSHLDNLRLIERAIRHARIPVLYSQGFNPMMKLSFGPPLPLGFTSEAEFLDITLEANFMPYIVENIKKSLPEGLSVYDNKVVLTKNKSLSSLLNRVIYKVDTNLISKRVDLLSNIKMLLNSESLNIERTGKRETVAVEIRQAVYDLYIEDNFLNMILGMGDGGYARPSEVLTLLLGEEFDSYLLNSIHRYDMYRQNDKNEKISAMDL